MLTLMNEYINQYMNQKRISSSVVYFLVLISTCDPFAALHASRRYSTTRQVFAIIPGVTVKTAAMILFTVND